jgi:hypothetical protein
MPASSNQHHGFADPITTYLLGTLAEHILPESIKVMLRARLADFPSGIPKARSVLRRCIEMRCFQAVSDEERQCLRIMSRNRITVSHKNDVICAALVADLQLLEDTIGTENRWEPVTLWSLLASIHFLSGAAHIHALIPLYLIDRTSRAKSREEQAMLRLAAALCSVDSAWRWSKEFMDTLHYAQQVMQRAPRVVSLGAVFGMHRVDFDDFPLKVAGKQLKEMDESFADWAKLLML